MNDYPRCDASEMNKSWADASIDVERYDSKPASQSAGDAADTRLRSGHVSLDSGIERKSRLMQQGCASPKKTAHF
jgi:hypothetical protein